MKSPDPVYKSPSRSFVDVKPINNSLEDVYRFFWLSPKSSFSSEVDAKKTRTAQKQAIDKYHEMTEGSSTRVESFSEWSALQKAARSYISGFGLRKITPEEFDEIEREKQSMEHVRKVQITRTFSARTCLRDFDVTIPDDEVVQIEETLPLPSEARLKELNLYANRYNDAASATYSDCQKAEAEVYKEKVKEIQSQPVTNLDTDLSAAVSLAEDQCSWIRDLQRKVMKDNGYTGDNCPKGMSNWLLTIRGIRKSSYDSFMGIARTLRSINPSNSVVKVRKGKIALTTSDIRGV